MKKFITLTAVALLLSACTGGHTQQINNQIESAAQKEGDAWAHAQKLFVKQCLDGTGDQPVPRAKAVASTECYEDLVRQRVTPVAIAPLLVNELLANYKQTAIDYQNGKIERDQANLNKEKFWNAYLQKLDTKGNDALMQARQADQIDSQNRQQALQKLGKELMQDPPAPKTTRCNVFAGTMTCTEM